VATLTFDTLKLAKRLEASGFTPQQAADAAEALAESLTTDISELATRADIGDVRREIVEAKANILKWMFGAMAAQTGLIVALLKLL
jgi:hypothetical protein